MVEPPPLSPGRWQAVCGLSFLVLSLSGCTSFLPTIGPSRSAIEHSSQVTADVGAIELVDVNESVTQELLSHRQAQSFAQVLGHQSRTVHTVGMGDALEVSIWEAPPATLFGAIGASVQTVAAPPQATSLPEQYVSEDGTIEVPFAGRLSVAGKTLAQIESSIAERLSRQANQPQVIVRLSQNRASTVTVVGEVTTNTRVSLLPGNEHLLDAIAAAGGVRNPVGKTMIQVTRGNVVAAESLDRVIREPQQNVPLQPGDVVAAYFQPFYFTALGATGKNDEIAFEAQGISLSQALARAGGLIDQRSNAKGVFIFRLAKPDAMTYPHAPTKTTPDGLVPVVFRVDLTDPNSFFVMQSFPMESRDVLYVSNAPVTEIQKALNVLFSVAYPILTVKQVGL